MQKNSVLFMDRHTAERDRDVKLGHVSSETGHFETQLFFLYQSDQLSSPLLHGAFKNCDHILGHKKKKFFLNLKLEVLRGHSQLL